MTTTPVTSVETETGDDGSEPAPATSLHPVEGSTSSGYVVPLVHARLPEPVVDIAFWASVGAVAAVGVIDLPVAGAIATGMFVLRRRHRS